MGLQIYKYSDSSIREKARFTDGLPKSAIVVRKSGHFTDDLLESIPSVRKSGYFTDEIDDCCGKSSLRMPMSSFRRRLIC